MKKLWFNGVIYTMVREEESVESVLTEDGRILAVGSYGELHNEADEFIDLQGATMFPGFVDSHIHMIGFGKQLKSIDLTKVTSKQQMLDKLRTGMEKLATDEWLVADGFNENNFPDRAIPTAQELDEITEQPIVISRVCRHVYLGNHSALKKANLENYIDSDKGSVGRHADGRLNGLAYEAAATQLRDAQLPQNKEGQLQALQNELNLAIDQLHSVGITGAHTEDMNYYGPYENSYEAYATVMAKRQDFRCNLLIHHEVFEGIMMGERAFNEDFMELGAMKIFADGSFGGSTAALVEDYRDQEGWKGTLIHRDVELEELFKLARSYNRPIAVHLIGDAAAEQIVSMIEKYPPPAGTRDRLIHACLVNERLLQRMAKLSVIVDVQPLFVLSDFPWVAEKIGQQRLPYAYAWKSFIEAGIPCAGSSDAPVEAINPLLGIYAAVEREKNGEVFVPEQRISRYEAIQMYTLGSAKAINHEHERGFIKAGYVADFSVFDKDLFTVDLREIRAIMTVVNGRIVHEVKK